MALLDDLLRQFPTLQVERDIDAYLLNHYPQSYRDVVDADMEMGRSYHSGKVFTGPGGEVIGLNLYKTDLTDEQAQWLIQADWPHLRVLNLARNQLTRFVFTEKMPALTRVGINHNEQLQSLRCEDGLDQLRWVDAAFCDLRQFRVPKSYTGLQFLRLDGNKQLGDFRFDGPCPWLEVLFLRGGSLKSFSLPAGFGQLVHLYLNQNQIETLELAGELGELRTLQLRGNKLDSLPFSLIRYKKLEALYVGDNPLSQIPSGIITKEKDQSSLSEVLSYLREADKGERPNTRVKLVLVGNGRTGKTSLYRRLKGEPFNPREKFTHGVQLGQLDKQHLPNVHTESLELQVWDFGGQEIFYATHQFFLNDNALYLLTWTDPSYVEEARKQIESDFPNEAWRSREYWLENIRHHAPGSPILMVQTFADKRKIPIDEAGYFEHPYRAACLTFDASNDLGLAELRREVGRKLSQELDFLGMPIANTYLDAVAKISEIVDERNRSRERPVISWADFEALCHEIGLEPGEENARNLCRYLHHAGALVYFGDDARFPNLRDLIFIDPDWLTTQVYKLVNPSLLHSEPKGRITAAYVAKAWSDFSPREQAQMLELLTGFDLIFKERGKGDRYIAPQYLPEVLSEEAQTLLHDREEALKAGFSFRFTGYMPDNVTVNFLCKYGPYSSELYWRNGIAFKNQANAEAVVRFDPQARLCQVSTANSPEGKSLQREICQAFLALSKHAPAEVSLDGEHFVSWPEVKKCFELGNLRIQACHIDTGAALIQEAAAFRHLVIELRTEFSDEPMKESSESPTLPGPDAFHKKDLMPSGVSEQKILAETVEENAVPKGILFLAANPDTLSKVRTDQEHRILKAEFERGESARKYYRFLDSRFAVTISELTRALNDGPQIIHFAGHGKQEGIIISDENNQPLLLPEGAIRRIFKNLKAKTELVILNACYSAEQARVISSFGIYVMGSNDQVWDEASVVFSKGFYLGLGLGKSYEDCYNDGIIQVATHFPAEADKFEVWHNGKKLPW